MNAQTTTLAVAALLLATALMACQPPASGSNSDKSAQKDTPAAAAAKAEPIAINAADYHAVWRDTKRGEHRHAAWRSYHNRTLKVSGELVRRTEVLGQVELALRGDDENGEVVCTVPNGVDATKARIGQTITVQGMADDWLVGPLLRDCTPQL